MTDFFTLYLSWLSQIAEAQHSFAEAFFSPPVRRPVLVLIRGGKQS